jgi:3'-5' exoribonuclease
MELLTISETRKRAQSGNVSARVHVQVNAAAAKATREGKPYCELTLADACDRMTLRVWSDHPDYRACDSLEVSDFIELTGDFEQHQQFGLDAKRWTVRALTAEEISGLLQGPTELRAKQAADWAYMIERIAAIGDPRLRLLSEAFVADYGDRFRRTAGARSYHHARRGGLVEHTAQMMRLAVQIAPLYTQLNLDLLIAGILFHDSGKLWENQLPENGFTMGFDERGELMGHISIGMELVNSFWRKLQADNALAWQQLTPASDDVRDADGFAGDPEHAGSDGAPLHRQSRRPARDVLRRVRGREADSAARLRSGAAIARQPCEAAGEVCCAASRTH